MTVLLSFIFKVIDHGDGTEIKGTVSEVALSTILYITTSVGDKDQLAQRISNAITMAIRKHKEDFHTADAAAHRIRFYELISHSLLSMSS